MKKDNTLSTLTIDELNVRKKKLQGATIGLGIVLVVACIFLFYVALTSGQPALLAVATACPLTFLPVLINLVQLNAEIKKRKQA